MTFKQAIRSGPLSGHVAIAKFHGLRDAEDALHAAAFKDLMQIMDTIHVDQKQASLHGMATTKLKKTVLNLRHAHGG